MTCCRFLGWRQTFHQFQRWVQLKILTLTSKKRLHVTHVKNNAVRWGTGRNFQWQFYQKRSFRSGSVIWFGGQVGGWIFQHFSLWKAKELCQSCGFFRSCSSGKPPSSAHTSGAGAPFSMLDVTSVHSKPIFLSTKLWRAARGFCWAAQLPGLLLRKWQLGGDVLVFLEQVICSGGTYSSAASWGFRACSLVFGVIVMKKNCVQMNAIFVGLKVTLVIGSFLLLVELAMADWGGGGLHFLSPHPLALASIFASIVLPMVGFRSRISGSWDLTGFLSWICWSDHVQMKEHLSSFSGKVLSRTVVSKLQHFQDIETNLRICAEYGWTTLGVEGRFVFFPSCTDKTVLCISRNRQRIQENFGPAQVSGMSETRTLGRSPTGMGWFDLSTAHWNYPSLTPTLVSHKHILRVFEEFQLKRLIWDPGCICHLSGFAGKRDLCSEWWVQNLPPWIRSHEGHNRKTLNTNQQINCQLNLRAQLFLIVPLGRVRTKRFLQLKLSAIWFLKPCLHWLVSMELSFVGGATNVCIWFPSGCFSFVTSLSPSQCHPEWAQRALPLPNGCLDVLCSFLTRKRSALQNWTEVQTSFDAFKAGRATLKFVSTRSRSSDYVTQHLTCCLITKFANISIKIALLRVAVLEEEGPGSSVTSFWNWPLEVKDDHENSKLGLELSEARQLLFEIDYCSTEWSTSTSRGKTCGSVALWREQKCVHDPHNKEMNHMPFASKQKCALCHKCTGTIMEQSEQGLVWLFAFLSCLLSCAKMVFVLHVNPSEWSLSWVAFALGMPQSGWVGVLMQRRPTQQPKFQSENRKEMEFNFFFWPGKLARGFAIWLNMVMKVTFLTFSWVRLLHHVVSCKPRDWPSLSHVGCRDLLVINPLAHEGQRLSGQVAVSWQMPFKLWHVAKSLWGRFVVKAPNWNFVQLGRCHLWHCCLFLVVCVTARANFHCTLVQWTPSLPVALSCACMLSWQYASWTCSACTATFWTLEHERKWTYSFAKRCSEYSDTWVDVRAARAAWIYFKSWLSPPLPQRAMYFGWGMFSLVKPWPHQRNFSDHLLLSSVFLYQLHSHGEGEDTVSNMVSDRGTSSILKQIWITWRKHLKIKTELASFRRRNRFRDEFAVTQRGLDLNLLTNQSPSGFEVRRVQPCLTSKRIVPWNSRDLHLNWPHFA